MAAALILSTVALLLDYAGFGRLRDDAADLFSTIDFSEVLMEGMLSFLLFAGAEGRCAATGQFRWQVGLLAVFGAVGAAFTISIGLYYLLP